MLLDSELKCLLEEYSSAACDVIYELIVAGDRVIVFTVHVDFAPTLFQEQCCYHDNEKLVVSLITSTVVSDLLHSSERQIYVF